jgi:hypothetical protein
MATLCGFMFGSLRKIWPFKHDVSHKHVDMYLESKSGFLEEEIKAIQASPETIVEYLKPSERIYENIVPAFDSMTMICIGVALVGIVLVFALDRVSNVSADTHPLKDEPEA